MPLICIDKRKEQNSDKILVITMHKEKYEQCYSNSYSGERKHSQSFLKRQSVIKLPNLHAPVIFINRRL